MRKSWDKDHSSGPDVSINWTLPQMWEQAYRADFEPGWVCGEKALTSLQPPADANSPACPLTSLEGGSHYTAALREEGEEREVSPEAETILDSTRSAQDRVKGEIMDHSPFLTLQLEVSQKSQDHWETLRQVHVFQGETSQAVIWIWKLTTCYQQH